MRKIVLLTIVMALAVGACSTTGAEPGAVVFDLAAIEIKGSTDGIPAPDIDPTTLSAGYRYKAPGVFDAANPNKWEVSTYLYSPGSLSVVQGDEVTLRIFGINGDTHEMWVEAPDGTKVTEVTTLERGRQLTLGFTADELGHYRVVCATHAPTMTADILSLAG